MTEKIVVVERGGKGRIIIGIFAILFVVIIVFFALYATGYWQPPAGDDSGPEERTWFKTTIVCSNQWVYNPYIHTVRTVKISANVMMHNQGRFVNPLWDEKCILAVSIEYPSGREVAFNDKPIELGNSFWFSPDDYTFSYSWFTTWSGEHIVTVKLFADAHGGRGSLFDTHTNKVDV